MTAMFVAMIAHARRRDIGRTSDLTGRHSCYTTLLASAFANANTPSHLRTRQQALAFGFFQDRQVRACAARTDITPH
jgi:hypothetical protein